MNPQNDETKHPSVEAREATSPVANTMMQKIFGTWTPPDWLSVTRRTLSTGMRQHWLAVVMVLCVLVGGTVIWQQWQKWWSEHQPQARVLVEKRILKWKIQQLAPEKWVEPRGGNVGVLAAAPLLVSFDGPAAPLGLIGKPIETGVKIEPEIAGKWSWVDEKQMQFMPDQRWQAGTEYRITVADGLLVEGASVNDRAFLVTSPVVSLSFQNCELDTNVQAPTEHRVVGTIKCNYGLTLEEVQKRFSHSMIKNTGKVFAEGEWKIVMGANPMIWHFRSPLLTLPKQPAYAQVEIAAGLTSSSGGKGLEKTVGVEVKVPDRFSGLRVASISASMVRNEEGEPVQMMQLSVTQPMTTAEVKKRVRAWRLQEKDEWDSKGDKIGVNQVTKQMLARAKEVPLEWVIVEGDAPVKKSFACRFFVPEPKDLLIQVDGGAEGLGGFVMPDTYRMWLTAPSFPRELRVIGKGNVLALNGDQCLQLKSRGVEYIRVTLGRVRSSDINHLITQNDYGNFSNISTGSGFPIDNLTRTQQVIVRVGMENEWQAMYTPFSINSILKQLDPSDASASRGLFVMKVDALTWDENDQEKKSILDEVESSDLYYDGMEWEMLSAVKDPILKEKDGTSGDLKKWVGEESSKHGEWQVMSRLNEEDSESDEEDSEGAKLMMVTDLGPLVKSQADGSRAVYVMSLSRQLPEVGVKASIIARNGSALATGLTNDQGFVTLPAVKSGVREQQPMAIAFQKGNDFCYIPLRSEQLPTMDYSRFDIDGVNASRNKAVEAHVFTERGVYRPGESVYFGTIVRRRDWQSVLAGLPIVVELVGQEDEVKARKEFVLAKDGFVDGCLPTNEAIATGTYEVQAWVTDLGEDDGKNRQKRIFLGRTPIRVEDFRADRLKMSVQLLNDQKQVVNVPKGWLKPESLSAKLQLDNLYGAPAQGCLIKTTMSCSPTEFVFAQWPDYQFMTEVVETTSEAGKEIQLGEQRTQENGSMMVSLPMQQLAKSQMRVMICYEALEKDGGFGVKEMQEFLVSSRDQVVGYKADGDLGYISKDSVRKVRLVAVGQNLQAVVLPGVKYQLNQNQYVNVLRKDEQERMVYQSEKRSVMVKEGEIGEIGLEGMDWSLDTGRIGEYTLTLLDEKGDVLTKIPYYVAGKGQMGRSLERSAELVMKPSKHEVMPGETIQLSITAPYMGAGLITLERDRVLYAQWFHADTQTSVQQIKIPDGIEGTVYCNVSFVRSLASEEVMMTPFSYAVQPIQILPVKHRLGVKVSVPSMIRPGQSMPVTYQADSPSRVILYAVDEGIHRISNYQLPKSLDVFYKKQALEVMSHQWFDHLMPEYRYLKQGAAYGGDGESMDKLNLHLNPFKRKTEASVVWWSGILEAGPTAKTVDWIVPDTFVGGLNVMAVAVSEQAMGSAKAHAVVKSPLVITNQMPVQVAPGDEWEASVTVANQMEKEGESSVEIQLDGSKHLQVLGDRKAQVRIKKSGEATIKFRVKVLDELGAAEMKVQATCGDEKARRTDTLSVRPAMPYQTWVRSSYIRTKSHQESLPRSLYAAYRQSFVVASPMPVVLIHGLRRYLDAYEHQCTEQLTSRGMAYLSCLGLQGVETEAQQQLGKSQLVWILSQLERRQNGDGSLSYWGSGSSSSAFLSLYGLHFLMECKELGIREPANMHERLLAWTKTWVESKVDINNLDEVDLKGYGVYLLARSGYLSSATPMLKEALKRDQRGKWENRLVGTCLAASFKLSQQEAMANEIVADWQGVSKYRVTPNHGGEYWQSEDVFRLLQFAIRAKHFPEAVKKYGYADWQLLYQQIWNERFNTLTAAYAALGMKNFSKVVAELGLNYQVQEVLSSGDLGKILIQSDRVMSRADIGMSAKGLAFDLKQEKSDLGIFYQVIQQGYDRQVSKDPQIEGLEVYREITDAQGKPIDKLALGETAMVKIRVRNISPGPLDSIALIDLLSGGYAVDQGGLKPGVNAIEHVQRVDVREDRNLFYLSLSGKQERVIQYPIKGVSVGKFVVPPVFGESMYDRGINGRSASGMMEVVAKP